MKPPMRRKPIASTRARLPKLLDTEETEALLVRIRAQTTLTATLKTVKYSRIFRDLLSI